MASRLDPISGGQEQAREQEGLQGFHLTDKKLLVGISKHAPVLTEPGGNVNRAVWRTGE
jgi:hypothetical protein